MKKDVKKELLETLKKDMKQMMMEEKKPMLLDKLMPKIDELSPEEGEGVQKVTVMSDSKEGLEKGLSKAKEIMKAKLAKKSK